MSRNHTAFVMRLNLPNWRIFEILSVLEVYHNFYKSRILRNNLKICHGRLVFRYLENPKAYFSERKIPRIHAKCTTNLFKSCEVSWLSLFYLHFQFVVKHYSYLFRSKLAVLAVIANDKHPLLSYGIMKSWLNS